ncbi:MAG: SDR family NAD(P)-dependent oxidoreductase [Candidatus Humimicrobiaceae bacterium]
MDIRNKVVIITGASAGIGLATAKLFAKNGAKVALAARSKDKLNKLAAELQNSFAIPTDMTKNTSIENMVKEVCKHYGRIDILINNAGQGYDGLIEHIDVKKYQYIIDLNLIGPLIAMQEVIPVMRKQGGGVIVNISSGLSKMYIPNMAGYASIKSALNTISLTARKELANDKIAVSVVYPYMTATDFEKNTITSKNYNSKQEAVEPNEEYNSLPPPDSAETVAKKILEVVISERAEQSVHDWLATGK